jgi:hypothetical protein
VADSATDGRTRVYSVPSISNIASPTVAELNAGTDLSSLITPDGLVGLQAETADVDNSALNSTFTTNTPGRISYSGTGLRLKKQTGTDTVYNTLIYGYATNLVVRRDVTSSTAWTASQAVEVYPVTCGEVQNQDPAPNELHKYFVPMKVSTQPNLRASVAA